MKHMRKALMAAVTAAGSAVVAAIVEGGAPNTTEGWIGLVFGALGLGLGAGAAVYTTRNVGTGIAANGSEGRPAGAADVYGPRDV